MSKESAAAQPSPRYKPYPAYKDSGVEWLGRIPTHWAVSRADAFLRYEKVQVEPSSLSEELVFHYSIPLVQETGDGALEPPSEIDSAKLRILGERLLVSKLNPRKGVVIIASEKNVPTICSTEFVPFEVRGCDLRWALYLFLTESTRQRLSAVVRSATRSHQRAEISEIVKIWHGVPPVPDQRAIAAFLDRETAKIDALVAKKERLIELLQEKRAALITQAVTKGLPSTGSGQADPNVPMKDSGVEWLGQIPAHWKLGKMWDVSWASSGGTPPKEVLRYWNGEIPWVSPKDMKRRFIDSTEDTVAEAAISEAGLRMIAPPAVLVVVRGMILAHTFPVAITTVPVTINQDMKALRLRQDLDPEFFGYWLEGLGRNLLAVLVEEAAHGTKAIRMDRWRVTPVQIPPIEEQRAIMVFLDSELGKIDALVAKVVAAVDRLKEYRTALISAAVTGKIDVREEVA